MNTTQSYIFLSAERSENDFRTNYQLTCELDDLLKEAGISFQRVSGVYDGVAESSVMIPWSVANESLVFELAQEFNQDCYLVVDSNRYGHLVYTDSGKSELLGKYRTTGTKPSGDHTKLVEGMYLEFI